MADSPFVAEIRAVGFDFAPTGWAMCNGQLMPISQNTALFSLLGTFYGGNGLSTFALPNLQGTAALNVGQGPGLSQYDLGQVGGTEFVTLLQSETPPHTHTAQAYAADPAEQSAPSPVRAIAQSAPGSAYQSDTTNNLVSMNQQATTIVGGSLPHNNMPPYLTLNYIIALQGVFPPHQ